MDSNERVNQIYTWIKYGCYQRSLHYHNTPKRYTRLYRRQLQYIKEHYEVQTPEQLKEYLLTGKRKEKPSLLIGAFDGYRNQYEVLWKLLSELDLIGWFLLVTDFVNSAGSNQEAVLSQYQMQWLLDEYADGRYAMNWEEAKEISSRHIMINHTSTHYRLTEQTKDSDLHYEICHAQELMEQHLHQKPEIFSWLGGAWLDQNPQACRMLREKGYQFLLGYRLEYMDESNSPAASIWETAVDAPISESRLDREVRFWDQVMSNIGWYSAVPAILPCYQNGRFVYETAREEDQKLAEHFAALAHYLITVRGMGEASVSTALDVLAVTQIGEGFPFHEWQIV